MACREWCANDRSQVGVSTKRLVSVSAYAELLLLLLLLSVGARGERRLSTKHMAKQGSTKRQTNGNAAFLATPVLGELIQIQIHLFI